MDDQAAQEEIQHLRQEIQEIDAELARLRTERRLFGRSSFSPEWLILRQRSLHSERDRCQTRLRELARAGHASARGRASGGKVAPVLKAAVYLVSGLAIVLVAAAAYVTVGQGRPAAPVVTVAPTVVAAPTATAVPEPTAVPTPAVTKYTVIAGDTVSKIAQKFGVTVEDITKANKLSDPRLINVGQELVIPPAPATPPPAGTKP